MPVSIIAPVIGHRGASAYAPENTLASFSKAKELGVKWVEFDVMLAACGELVVIHDETVDRTTNGQGLVIDFPYQYLKKLDAGSWFDQRFCGQHIPTLQEVLNFLQREQMAANIEIKAQPGMEKRVADQVITLLKKEWKNALSTPLVSSFSQVTLRYLREASSTCSLGFLMHEWQADWDAICQKLNCTTVGVNCDILDEEKIKQIKATQRWLLAYTVNDLTMAKKLFATGVDTVFSDCPDRVLKLGEDESHGKF